MWRNSFGSFRPTEDATNRMHGSIGKMESKRSIWTRGLVTPVGCGPVFPGIA